MLAASALTLAAILSGCGDPSRDRINAQIRKYEELRSAKQPKPPPPATGETTEGLSVTPSVRLNLGISFRDAAAVLPRSPGDPDDLVSGSYTLAIRGVAGGTASLAFRSYRLTSISVSRWLDASAAGAERARMEREYGKPAVSGGRLTWSRPNGETVTLQFQAEGEGYRVVSARNNAEAAKDLAVGMEPGSRPIPNIRLPDSATPAR